MLPPFYGNIASTDISLVPATRQQMRGPTIGRQHTRHRDAGTTTGSARTNKPNDDPSGRLRPADSTPSRQIAALRT